MARGSKTKKQAEGHEYQINKNVTLVCYDWEDRQSCKLIICDAFVVYGRIFEGKKGNYFMSFPSYKCKDGSYKNSAFSIDADITKAINDAVNEFMNEDD